MPRSRQSFRIGTAAGGGLLALALGVAAMPVAAATGTQVPGAEQATHPGPTWDLRVLILAPDGEPAAGATLVVHHAYPTGYPLIDRRFPYLRNERTQTDPDGTATLTDLDAAVAIYAEGSDGSMAFRARVEPFEVAARIQLEEPANLEVESHDRFAVRIQSADGLVPILVREQVEGTLPIPAGDWWICTRHGGNHGLCRRSARPGESVIVPAPIHPTSRLEVSDTGFPFLDDSYVALPQDPRVRPGYGWSAVPNSPNPLVHRLELYVPNCFIEDVHLLRTFVVADPSVDLRATLEGVEPRWIEVESSKAGGKPGIRSIVSRGSEGDAEIWSFWQDDYLDRKTGILLESGSFEALVISPGFADQVVTLDSLRRRDNRSVLLQPADVLSLRFTTREGSPLRDLTVETDVGGQRLLERVVRTTSEGLAVLTRLPRADEREITVRRDGGFPRRYTIIGTPASVDIRWETGRPITGTVVGPSGAPLSTIAVELRAPELGDLVEPIYRVSGDDGGFVFEDLPPRVFLLSVYAEIDGAPFIGQLRAEPGDEPWELRLQSEDPLPPGSVPEGGDGGR